MWYYKISIYFHVDDLVFPYLLNDIGREFTDEKYSEEAKKYYMLAIKYNHIPAIYNIALYYDLIDNNYEEAIKYYEILIEYKDPDAMYRLGRYYDNIEKNYKKAIKYYCLAIEYNYEDIYWIRERLLVIFMEQLQIIISNYLINIFDVSERISAISNNCEKNYCENTCACCMSHESILLNLKCKKKYNHYYCISCFYEWYKDNKKKCLLCLDHIKIDNISIAS
jgi:tetratricopeptide (TPR) repeat protein